MEEKEDDICFCGILMKDHNSAFGCNNPRKLEAPPIFPETNPFDHFDRIFRIFFTKDGKPI